MSDILERIGKLALQAERAGTEEEAIAFAEKAQKLATLAGIDLEVARRQQADKSKRQVPTQKRIVIGKRGSHALRTYAQLLVSIATENNLKVNISHQSDWLILFGFESDIAVTEALYASLVIQMAQACEHYLASEEFALEEVWSEYSYSYKKMGKSSGRINFQQGFSSSIGIRLALARREAEIQAEKVQVVIDGQSTGKDMVLAAKQVEVADYYQTHSRARGSWKGDRVATDSHGARSAGAQAGQRARLGAEKSIGGSRTSIQS